MKEVWRTAVEEERSRTATEVAESEVDCRRADTASMDALAVADACKSARRAGEDDPYLAWEYLPHPRLLKMT